MPRSKRRFIALLAPLLILFSITVTGCGAATPVAVHVPAMASMADMPAEVKAAPIVAQQTYQFAMANPEVLKKLPCYCGCGKMGHTSNYNCYVKSAEGAKVIYDNHALGCSICVDITQEAMRQLRQGKSVADISRTIDTTFAKYGPSNMAPPP